MGYWFRLNHHAKTKLMVAAPLKNGHWNPTDDHETRRSPASDGDSEL
jgi:hypothetical protein